MARDIGKRRCYRAEEAIYNGPWFKATCTSPLLTEQEARVFHLQVAEYLRDELKITWPLPHFIVLKKSAGHSFCRFLQCHYVLRSLRKSTIMHEVAHWAAGPGEMHSRKWQEIFAKAIAKFDCPDRAKQFLYLCEKLPVMRVAAGPKRRWILQELQATGWIDSKCPRDLIPGPAKAKMWRGRMVICYRDGKATQFRMIEDQS